MVEYTRMDQVVHACQFVMILNAYFDKREVNDDPD
jgi:hypothetical protein